MPTPLLTPSLSHPLELTLRLPAPHAHIVVTPPRDADRQHIVAILNDLRISRYLSSPPYPYTLADCDDFFPTTIARCADGRAQYDEWCAGTRPWLGETPVRCLRDTSVEGEPFIGSVDVVRATFANIVDAERRQEAKKANDALEPGNEGIVWEFGGMWSFSHGSRECVANKEADYLASSHHGQNIMSAAIKAIMDFAVRYMNAHVFQIHYSAENRASRRVFEKNGFVDFDFVPDAWTMPKSKGGDTVSWGVMRWYKPVEQ